MPPGKNGNGIRTTKKPLAGQEASNYDLKPGAGL
jgi:hypothetical protein